MLVKQVMMMLKGFGKGIARIIDIWIIGTILKSPLTSFYTWPALPLLYYIIIHAVNIYWNIFLLWHLFYFKLKKIILILEVSFICYILYFIILNICVSFTLLYLSPIYYCVIFVTFLNCSIVLPWTSFHSAIYNRSLIL